MATLQIQKKSNKVWLHVASDQQDFIISKFYFNADGLEFQIVEQGQSKRNKYSLGDISVFDIGGSAEVFLTMTALALRLEALKYPAFYRDGESILDSFLDLTDTPSSYVGQAGKVVKVKSGEDGLEFGNPSGFNLKVYETGETPIENIDEIEFDGATVTDDGGGKITVTITSPGGTPTLQEVLDNNHDLVDGNNFQGTGAGDGNTGTEVNAFGTDAGVNNTGFSVNAFGYSAGQDNTGISQNAFGSSAGAENTANNQNAFGEIAGGYNTGENQNALGSNAGYENQGDNQNALGENAGQVNSGANQNALGSGAGGYNTGDNQNALGENAGYQNEAENQNALGANAGQSNTGANQNAFGSKAGQNNTGNNQNALGLNAGKNNSGRSQNAFGNTAGQDNTGDNVNAFGDRAGDGNTFNNVNLFGAGAQADEDGQTVFSVDGAIMARFSTVELTDARKYTLPDASGTLALLYDIPPAITIDSNPTDGSSNAVSSNGVFDALALKPNLTVSTINFVSCKTLLPVTPIAGAGSGTWVEVYKKLIPANTVADLSEVLFEAIAKKTGSAAITVLSILAKSGSDNFATAIEIGSSGNWGATSNRLNIRREYVRRSTSIEGITTVFSNPTDEFSSVTSNTSNQFSTYAIDFTQDTWVYLAVKGNASDSFQKTLFEMKITPNLS